MKKLAIIGASYLQLPLVIKAKEMGLETHCFAWEDGAVCKNASDFFYPISITDKEKILAICQYINIDGITSIASDVAVPTMSYISEALGLIGNTYKSALASTDKYLMRKRFSEYDISSPQYFLASDDFSINALNFPVIVKPTDRSGSLGVKRVNNSEELNHAITSAKNESFTQRVIIEEYIKGYEVSVEAISWNKQHYILAITDKITTEEPYFVELQHHQPSLLNNHIQTLIKQETLKALNALGIEYGASHSEFKITEDGSVYAIEVGARMGGDFIGSDLVQLSTGYDFLKGVINVSLGHFEIPTFLDQKYSGVYFLSRETDFLLPLISNIEKYPEFIRGEILDTKLHNLQASRDRSGYLIYQTNKRITL